MPTFYILTRRLPEFEVSAGQEGLMSILVQILHVICSPIHHPPASRLLF